MCRLSGQIGGGCLSPHYECQAVEDWLRGSQKAMRQMGGGENFGHDNNKAISHMCKKTFH